MSLPLASVMMPAFNACKTIGQAIASVLSQTHANLELIVVDDGSRDGTFQIASEAAERDSRVKVLRHGKNRGEAAARNTAFEHCRGEFIARLDADDWDHPTRIEKSVARLNAFPRCDCVSAQMLMGPEGSMWEPQDTRRGMVPDEFIRGGSNCNAVNASIVARRSIYELVGEFDTSLRVGTDADWNARAIIAGARWAFIDEPLYYYRKYPGQLVNSINRAAHAQLKADRVRKYLTLWEADYNPARVLSWFMTGACNRDCRDCSQKATRNDLADYFSSQDEIDRLIQRVRENGADYLWLELLGGEPALWPLLDSALCQLRTPGPFRRVRMFTNCVEEQTLNNVAHLLDEIYTSNCNADAAAAKRLKERYGKKVFISMMKGFKALPLKPLDGALPAKCNCNRPNVVKDRVWICPNAYPHARRLGIDMGRPDLSCSIDEDWIEHFRHVDKDNLDICAACLGNSKVWSQVQYPDGGF